jgi:TatA/E family protein of Tat protein translocase
MSATLLLFFGTSVPASASSITSIKERHMGSMSIMHWLIVVAVVLLLFGRGKIPELMGDVANGIKSFKKGMRDDEPDAKPGDSMLDLAKHIVNQKAGHFEPDKFEDQYETALIDLINQKRAGKPITAKERPRGENVVDLMDALRKSIGGGGGAALPEPSKKPVRKAKKAVPGQKEMLMPIAGKKPAKDAAAKKTAKPQRKSA